MTPFAKLVRDMCEMFNEKDEFIALALLDLFKRGVLNWRKL